MWIAGTVADVLQGMMTADAKDFSGTRAAHPFARPYIFGAIFGAGDRDRTGDIQLGKLTFCH